jgi:hypothetical protein
MNVAVFIASFGLIALTAFGMLAKRGILAGPISAVISIFQIPAFIALLWRLGQLVGWWTIAIFVVCSLISGATMAPMLGDFMRSGSRESMETLLGVQTMAGFVFVGCAIACWVV